MLIKERYPLTGKPYPKRLIFKVVGYSSSTWYENPVPGTGKRGRKPKHADEEYCGRSNLKLRRTSSTLKGT